MKAQREEELREKERLEKTEKARIAREAWEADRAMEGAWTGTKEDERRHERARCAREDQQAEQDPAKRKGKYPRWTQ